MADKILIVENEPAVADTIRSHVVAAGYGAEIARNASEAMELVKRSQPDVIVMDVNLGPGPDGIEAALRIREQCQRSVIFLTGRDNGDCLGRANVAEPLAYVLKPFDSAQLLEAIRIGLHRQCVERELQHSARRTEALQSLFDAVLWTDEKGVIKSIYPAGPDLLGVPVREPVGKPLAEICQIADSGGKNITAALIESAIGSSQGSPVFGEGTFSAAGGRNDPVAYRVVPCPLSSGGQEVLISISKPQNAAGGAPPDSPVGQKQMTTEDERDLLQSDPLTGLRTRKSAERLIASATETGQTMLIAVFVVDRYSSVCRRLGKDVGNEMVVLYGEHLTEHLFKGASLFRWTGPSFAVIINPLNPTLNVQHEIASIGRTSFSHYWQHKERSALIPVSATWAILSPSADKPVSEVLESIDNFVEAQSARAA